MLEQDLLPVDHILTSEEPLDAIGGALDAMRDGRAGKVVLRPSEIV